MANPVMFSGGIPAEGVAGVIDLDAANFITSLLRPLRDFGQFPLRAEKLCGCLSSGNRSDLLSTPCQCCPNFHRNCWLKNPQFMFGDQPC